MTALRLETLAPSVAARVGPFFEDVLSGYTDNVHSIHVVGSAVTADFNEKTSDVNSVFVLREMDLGFLEALAPRGRKYRKKRVAAPLIMTPGYIERSLDVFPIEFLELKLIHRTVLGEELLASVEVGRDDLRHQCEREIKSKLIWLRQNYLSSMGDHRVLTERLTDLFSGYMSLFRGIIFLLGREPPVRKGEVISALETATGVATGIFRKIFEMKQGALKPSREALNTIFEEYYLATEKIGTIVDELEM